MATRKNGETSKPLGDMTVKELEEEQAAVALERAELDAYAAEVKQALDRKLEASRAAAILGVDPEQLSAEELDMLGRLQSKAQTGEGSAVAHTNVIVAHSETRS